MTQTLTLPTTTTNRALAQTVAIFDPLEIAWEVSGDGQNWCPAGISENQAYVTLNDPVTTPKPGIAPPIVKFGNHPVYHSLLHLGCRAAQGVGGLSAEQETLEAIWTNGFSVNKATPITRVDGTPLTYYKTTTHGALYTAELLQSGEGICSAWATMFLDTLRIQGLVYPDAHVSLFPYHYLEKGEWFVMKEWYFGLLPVASQESGYEYLNIGHLLGYYPDGNPQFEIFTPDGIEYHWKYREVNDAPGIPGQGSNNPASLFRNHQLVYIGGKYYDPSYGRMYESMAALDTMMIDGYAKYNASVSFNEIDVGIDLDENGTLEPLTNVQHGFPIRKNPHIPAEYPIEGMPVDY